MKHKHGPKAPTIKVIADPKKLAWLKAEIEKRKARVPTEGPSPSGGRIRPHRSNKNLVK